MPSLDQANSLIKTYIADSNLGAYRAVVFASTEDHCDLPSGANDTGFAGFTPYAVTSGDKFPLHMSGGIALATASAAIALGADVMIADNTGKVKTATTDGNVVARALRAASADGDVIPVQVYYGAAGSGPLEGIIPSARLNIATDPSDTNTVTINGHVFTFLTTLIAEDTFTQVERGTSAAQARADFIDALNGVANANVVPASTPFALAVLADEVGTTVRLQAADIQGGTPQAKDASSWAVSETLTDAADIWNCANFNVSGKTPSDSLQSMGQIAITAEMVTYGSFTVEVPFTIGTLLWDGYASTGIKRAINEAVTFSGGTITLTLAGGGSPNWQAGDTFRFTAVE